MDCKLHFVFQAEGTINLPHATYKSKFIQSLISVSDGSTLQTDWRLLQNKIKISDYIAIREDLPVKSTLECKNIQCQKKKLFLLPHLTLYIFKCQRRKKLCPIQDLDTPVKMTEISYKHKESSQSSFTACNIHITSSNRPFQQIP